MSVPFKPFLVSKCLRQPKASAAIKDCLLYEGVNLLLASYSEGGGGYLWINASVVLNRPARHLVHHLCSSDIIKANTQHLLQYVCHTFKQPRFTIAAAVSHNMIDGHCFNIWISKSECFDITDQISTSNSSKTRLRSSRDVMRRALLLKWLTFLDSLLYQQDVPKRRWSMENGSTTLGHFFRAWFVTGGRLGQ